VIVLDEEEAPVAGLLAVFVRLPLLRGRSVFAKCVISEVHRVSISSDSFLEYLSSMTSC